MSLNGDLSKFLQGRELSHATGISLALGHPAGVTVDVTVGHNDGVGTTNETVWPPGGMYPWPTQATVCTIYSDSASDAFGGIGATAVLVNGLDADYNVLTEIVLLNGVTNVNSVGEFLRVNSTIVVGIGSEGENVGTIDVEVDGNVVSCIEPTNNLSSALVYTIPADREGFIYATTIGTGSGKEGVMTLWFTNGEASPFYNVSELKIYQSTIYIPFVIPNIVPEKSDIEIRCRSTASTISCHGNMGVMLVDPEEIT